MKGISIAQLPAVAMSIVFVGIVLGVSVYTNSQLNDVGWTDRLQTANNESLNFAVNDTCYNVAWPGMKSVSVYNDSAQTLLMYSTRCDDDRVKINANASCPVGIKYLDYATYYNRSEYWTIQNSTKGMANISSWLPTVGVVIAAGLIITLLFTAFATRKQGL